VRFYLNIVLELGRFRRTDKTVYYPDRGKTDMTDNSEDLWAKEQAVAIKAKRDAQGQQADTLKVTQEFIAAHAPTFFASLNTAIRKKVDGLNQGIGGEKTFSVDDNSGNQVVVRVASGGKGTAILNFGVFTIGIFGALGDDSLYSPSVQASTDGNRIAYRRQIKGEQILEGHCSTPEDIAESLLGSLMKYVK
jgi:hypothetical protein